jgi:adenylate cyclase
MRTLALPKRSTIIASVMIVMAGLVFNDLKVGGFLARLSFDLPFRFRQSRPTEAIIVTVDDQSRKDFGLPAGTPIPRKLQAELLERLTRDGARVVFYDLLFDMPSDDPAGDEAFAAAMRKSGNVVLSALYETPDHDVANVDIVTQPVPMFRDAARAWGLAGPLALDPDNAVRRIEVPGIEGDLAHWKVAELLKASVTKQHETHRRPRWLNYYGPAAVTIPWCTFYEALRDQRQGFFRDKIVCIGSRPPAAGRKFGQDEFGFPYSRWGTKGSFWGTGDDQRGRSDYIIGLEIHTTALLNLVRDDWLRSMGVPIQLVLVILIGILATTIAYSLSPVRGVLVLTVLAAGIAITSVVLQIRGNVWWNWMAPVAVQIPLAAIGSGASLYLGEVRRRAQLRQAFSLYLSPQMADRISEEQVDLKPGGKLVEATVMFTDCKGFTSMSEELKDAQRISETLIAYFTETSKHVLENDGTILKYIGDAVFACWNAPIAEPNHAVKAAKAAWAMHTASQKAILGRSLATRVGVCTGEVLAGNLGSPYRFDYTAIGDTVNFASRLEGLNKFLGTNVLIADSTRKRLDDQFVLRMLGNFIVAGKTSAVAIHELIAPPGESAGDVAWLAKWDESMKALRQGDFAAMQKALREVVWQRGGTDGPSEFYLKYLAKLEKEDSLREWTGIVKLTEK